MKKLLIIMILAATAAHAGQSLNADGNEAVTASRIEGVQQQMLQDEEIMAIISAMQEDPAMQSLLQDPAVLSAVQAGDVAALMANPAFMKILDDQRVKDIEKRLNTPGR